MLKMPFVPILLDLEAASLYGPLALLLQLVVSIMWLIMLLKFI